MGVVFPAWTGMVSLGSSWVWGIGVGHDRGVGWQLGTDGATWTGGLWVAIGDCFGTNQAAGKNGAGVYGVLEEDMEGVEDIALVFADD